MKNYENSPSTNSDLEDSQDNLGNYKYFQNNVSSKLIGTGLNKDGTQGYAFETTRLPIDKIEQYYVKDTDTLIGMFDGQVAESDHYMNGEPRHTGPVDRAIYLDKSARPVARIVRKLHDTLANSDTSKVPPASFLNIDKEDYLLAMGFDARELQNIDPDLVSLDKLDPGYRQQILAEIRAQYLSSEDLAKVDENNIQEVWDYPTILDGQHVAIVDEVKSSGNSLRIADQLISLAIPEANTEPMYWSVPGLNRWTVTDDEGRTHSEFAASRVPVWYNSDSVDGRLGIADRNPQKAEQSRSKRVRLGKHVLSTMLPGGMDATSKMIAHDISLLSKRLENGQVNYVPGDDFEDEVYKQKIEQYWGMKFKDWLAARRRGDL